MTAIYEAADQRVIEQDGLVLLEVDVDADEPTDPDWDIRLLAPVKADAGQAFAHRVNWRGRVSHRNRRADSRGAFPLGAPHGMPGGAVRAGERHTGPYLGKPGTGRPSTAR